jgi:L-ascorbate metabolism protein UlaG (beta-lactamase superfamily)
VPIHYGTLPIFKGTPDDFRQQLQARNAQADLVVIEPGQSVPIRRKAGV